MKKKKVPVLLAEKSYTVIEASLILGVTREWFYVYIKKYKEILIPQKSGNGKRQLFAGSQLITLKEMGVPNKRGRKKIKRLEMSIN
ncbi:MAG: DNA-binding protein [Bacteroides sp.]|nr:DNA-binding protein [Bacteroides sp.]